MKLLVLLTCLFAGQRALADVAVSIRYFKSEGESHYHLFLFRDDGELIRQLTSPENAHDVGPKFSKDGKGIVFLRKPRGKKPGKPGKGGQVWQIGVDGKGLRKLGRAPAGFPVTEEPPMYQAREAREKFTPVLEQAPGGFRLLVPESKLELWGDSPWAVAGNHDDLSAAGFIKLTLREAETKLELPFVVGDQPFAAYWMTSKGSPILRTDGLWVAFYYQLTGSSDAFRVGAIDLLGKRIVSLTERNPASIVPHGTRAGFFSIASELYQDLPGPEKLAVNCQYLDWWDKDFKRVRFAKGLSLLGGASARVKGQGRLDIPYME